MAFREMITAVSSRLVSRHHVWRGEFCTCRWSRRIDEVHVLFWVVVEECDAAVASGAR